MAILHGLESVPQVGDVVVKTTVDLYFSDKTFDSDFEIEFESGKKSVLSGFYGDISNNNGIYEKYVNLFNKIDLVKYKDEKRHNRFKIPLNVFSCALGNL